MTNQIKCIMKKIIPIIFVFCLAINAGIYVLFFSKNKNKEYVEAMEENLPARIKWNNAMLADPITGKTPNNIREKELAFSATLPINQGLGKSFGWWESRGPYNVGGRARTLVIDKNNENILTIGATNGGIWRSTSGGSYWFETTVSPESGNITSIVQDSRVGKSNIWYAGTGELYGGSLPGAFNSGNGIYKSTDGGLNWNKLTSINPSPGSISSDWSVIHRIALKPTTDSSELIFVATFNGIYRSLDGGKTWQKRRGTGTSGYSYYTDVVVTPSGIVYATLSGGGSHQGVWRSEDNGQTWINISPSWFSATSNRIVIGVSPSDEKQIYFASNTPNTGKKSLFFDGREEWNSLWKYTYISGNGSGTGGNWEDRSANLPAFGGAFGDFISQSGYCLDVRVKPDNPNVVFLGGTNLYRSTDGFATNTNTTWVGGYGVNSTFPDYTQYENQHPDQHNVIFYPSNPSKMISLHDGGISKTDDCLASTINWNSLNNGYITSQFYTVAMDEKSTSNILIGGLQDNGTFYTNSANAYSPWVMPGKGDGSYCFVKPMSTSEYYMSSQEGKIYRMILNANGAMQQMGRIDPRGVSKSKYQFINPFTPDANNWNKLFVPAGDVIWRNDSVSQIPLITYRDSVTTSLNWHCLDSTKLADPTDEITSILSSNLQTEVLYYATMKGKLYRLRNASANTSNPETISGTNFPNGYINCIVQHPTDSNKLYVVFTNYGVLSIFYSDNAGINWTAISGNLEENANGFGNGPSCRWLTIVPVQDSIIYFVGTSTGMYATKTLNGSQTIWTKQAPTSIGNNLVMMMKYRPTDGLMVAATFGQGIFSAKINSVIDNTSVNEISKKSINIYPNPATTEISIDMPDEINAESIFFISDAKGNSVKQGAFEKYDRRVNISSLANGIYILSIQSGTKKYSKKFLKE